MYRISDILKELNSMIYFNDEKIMMCFSGEYEVIIEEVGEKYFPVFKTCRCYYVYENYKEADIYGIYVSDDNIIVDVKVK